MQTLALMMPWRDTEAERKIVQKRWKFLGGGGGGAQRHDNKVLKVQILLSRNFVVIAQRPKPLREYTINSAENGQSLRIFWGWTSFLTFKALSSFLKSNAKDS